ncbi:MAG: hypothetical protein PHV68_07660 [Candidatus Gastranaerophilales bacterium]|nr:hypothetical protein [Candidatus Gastranaerophilales bacterium]
MSYKNDHLLTIMNKYGKSAGEAKAQMFETYDKLRDLTAGGVAQANYGSGPIGNFLMNMASAIAPSSFMPVLGSSAMNIPGTSYYSSISGGNSILSGGQSAFGYGELGNYSGFPTGGAASLFTGIGSSLTSLAESYAIGGQLTGGAASIANAMSAATGVSATTGTANGFSSSSVIMPLAGIISGVGGIATSLGPYFGSLGKFASIGGYLASGFGGAVLSGYQYTASRVVSNADAILSNKVKNIETVVKQLEAQNDVIKKMLKESLEGDSKIAEDL